MSINLKRVCAGLYESPDGRYEIAYDVTWLAGECECAICHGYMGGYAHCPNDGFGKREGWHIWDREADDYAAFAYEPQAFQGFRKARAALIEHLEVANASN